EEAVEELPVVDRAIRMVEVVEQVGRAQYLKARVDADQELGRPHPRLDRSELDPFDHAWDRAERAGREDVALERAVAPLLEAADVPLAPLVLDVVQGGRRALEGDRRGLGGPAARRD